MEMILRAIDRVNVKSLGTSLFSNVVEHRLPDSFVQQGFSIFCTPDKVDPNLVICV